MRQKKWVDPAALIQQEVPLVIAHRGASSTAPENSLEAGEMFSWEERKQSFR